MKKIKHIFCLLLSFILFITTSCTTNAQALDKVTDNDLFITQNTANDIFEEYKNEIQFIENASSTKITTLDQATIKLLSHYSALNLSNTNYRFSELMTDITIECEKFNSSDSNTISTNNTAETFSVVQSYTALRGLYITQAAPGSTKSGTATITVSPGDTIGDHIINVKFSGSVSYSVSGPADGTTLMNGKGATHRVAFLVLFGTILKNSSGQYYISTNTYDIMDYTTLAHINGYVYCHNIDNTMINYSASISAFKQRIQQYPKHYLALD